MIGKAHSDEASKDRCEESRDSDIHTRVGHQREAQGIPTESDDRDISEGGLRRIANGGEAQGSDGSKEAFLKDKEEVHSSVVLYDCDGDEGLEEREAKGHQRDREAYGDAHDDHHRRQEA